jgi:uncharacterized membrane protein YtjA (UPF0391 family)
MGIDFSRDFDHRLLGFTGISAGAADITRFLFYIFVVIFLVLLVLGLTVFRV